MITFEALDVILRVQNLPGFMARMRAGAKSVSSIGTAAVDSNKKASTAIYAAARKATLGLTAMAAIAAGTGYKLSVEFEKQLTLIHTQAGASVQEMNNFKQPLLDLAKTLPQGPIELVKGLYHIRSIGIPAAKAMEALKVAAQGAAVGNADLEQTTSALGAAWLAGIDGAGSFQHTMSVLNATVGAGNMRMDELVTALGTGVLPTAKLAGLSIQDVMAALALLKDEGYGAYGAMAQFATALHFFTDPTKKAQDALKKMGLSSLDIADTMRKRGMVAALALLNSHLKLTGEEMSRLSKRDWSPLTQQERLLGDILPGGRGRVFRVLLNQVGRYQMKLDQINRTSGNFHEAVRKTQATAAFKLHTAWSSVQADLIKLGDQLRGPATDAIIAIIGVFDKFLHLLGYLIDHIRTLVQIFGPLIAAWLTYKGIVIGTALVMRAFTAIQAVMFFIELARAIGFVNAAMLVLDALTISNPIALVAAAIVVAAILIVTHWKQVKHAAMVAWNWIVDHWKLIAIIIGGPIGAFAVLVVSKWDAIKQAGVDAWNAIKGAFNDTINFFTNKWRDLTSSGFVKFFTHLFGGGGGGRLGGPGAPPVRGRLGSYHPGGYTGGYVTAGGLMTVGEHGAETAILPTGTRIAPAGFHAQPGGAMAMAGSGIAEIHLHSYLDGKEVAESVSKHQLNKKARQ